MSSSLSRFSLREDDPLMDRDEGFSRKQGEAFLQFDNAIFEDDDSDDEDRAQEASKLIVKEQAYPGRKPMIIDAVCHVIEYLQYFALLQSLSLRWTWPLVWTRSMNFLFFFNLDFWEFVKVSSASWQASRDYIVPSADVPFNFRWWLIVWFFVLLLIVVSFFLVYWYLKRRETTKAIGVGTMMQKVAIGLAQVMALPLGVQIGKVFWCNPGTENVMNVANDITCWSGTHWVFIAVSVLVATLVYPVFAFWLYRVVKAQVLTSDHRRHEAYLQLKDCENRFGLDNAWTSRIFIAFASYRRRWVYARPICHLLKLYVICCYAGLFNFRLVQISLIALMFFLMVFFTVIPRVYRVTCYNFLALWCWLALFGNAATGVFINITDLESAFTTPDYVRGELILINVMWLVVLVLWILYVILRARGIICARQPLWPTMMSKGVKKLPENTLRYMQSALEGRFAVRKAMEVPALLAPVHDLSHHIHVINALAREAEYVNDPLHSSLRDVLDELIDLHAEVSPQSLFSESLKPTVHSTVQELLKVLPDFTRRLKQREFDFILTSPVRRRILLKLFIVSCFLNKSKAAQDGTGGEEGRGGTSRVLRRLWRLPSDDGKEEESEGRSISDEGFEGDELEGSQEELWNVEERRQGSVIVSPTPQSGESLA